MPTPSSLVVACTAILVVAHCCAHGADIISMLPTAPGKPKCSRRTKSQKLLDAAVWDIRIKQTFVTSQYFVQICVVAIVGLAFGMVLQPAFMSPFQVFIAMAEWFQHHLVVTEKLKLNKATVRFVVLIHHLQCSAFLWAIPNTVETAALKSVLLMTIRYTLAVLSADIQIAVPAQAMFSLFELWSAWQLGPSSVTMFFWYEPIAYVSILIVSGLVEFSTRSRVAMLLNSEAMVASFRQILRGLCDGEILLDAHLRVVGKAECLKRLLMTSDDFCNRQFQELLFDDERSRFTRFMSENVESSTTDADDPDTPKSAPACLRVSLKRGRHRIGVDLFHVRMPYLFGEETYHLVALSEDCESRAAREMFQEEAAADLTVPQIERAAKTAGSSKLTHCDSSVPQVSSTSLLQICAELEEMTLLVDATTPLLDVEQAHLSFVRRSDEADSSMPSLRRIVQPTDWGTVHSQLREFALTAGSMQSAASQRNVLKMKLRFQDDAKRCVEAREVQVSGFSPPVAAGSDEPMLKKLGLQIGGFKVVTKQKPRSNLQGVHEGDFNESEGEMSG